MLDVEGPPPGIYGTSPIKRLRATKAQVSARWTSLRQIVEQQRPFRDLVPTLRRQLAENPDA